MADLIEQLEALEAIYGEDVGIKTLNDDLSARLYVVNIRYKGELIGTVGFQANQKCISLAAVRAEFDGCPKQTLRDIEAYGRPLFSAAAHSEGGLFESVNRCSDRLAEVYLALLSAQGSKSAGGDGSEPPDSHGTLLLHLDHMRQRAEYVRTICQWADELHLTGALMFVGPLDKSPLTLILLHGTAEALKQYLKLHRTSTVDVDSTGRRCKEKQMDVLWQGQAERQANGSTGHGHSIADTSTDGLACCDAITTAMASLASSVGPSSAPKSSPFIVLELDHCHREALATALGQAGVPSKEVAAVLHTAKGGRG